MCGEKKTVGQSNTSLKRLLLPLHRSIRPSASQQHLHLCHQRLPLAVIISLCCHLTGINFFSPHYTTLPLLSPISHIYNVDPSPSFIWRCPPPIGVIVIVDSPNDIRFGTQGRCLHYWCRRGGCWSRWHILLITVGRDWQGGQTKEGPTEGC